MQLAEKIKKNIRDIHDFPKPGIVFKDITPLLAQAGLRQEIVTAIAQNFQDQKIDAVAGIEARGFILGGMIAQEMGLPFIPIRKAGKLPYQSIREEYALEYGQAAIEIHEDALAKGQRVLVHDDLLATGGTAAAAGKLVQKLGAEIAGFSFLINLSFLPGEQELIRKFSKNPFSLITF